MRSGTSPGRVSVTATPNCAATRSAKSVAPSFGIESPPVASTSDAHASSPWLVASVKPPGPRTLSTSQPVCDPHARGLRLRQQQRDDLARAAVAEELAELLLVEAHAVLLDQRDEVGRRVARERRAAEVRVLGEEVLGPRAQVGEVAAPAARDQDLAADLGVALEHEHAAPALAGLDRAHQAGRAAADHDHVEAHEPRSARGSGPGQRGRSRSRRPAPGSSDRAAARRAVARRASAARTSRSSRARRGRYRARDPRGR